MKLLIDECLSPILAHHAVNNGLPLSTHVTFRGMGGWSDARIMRTVLREGWTLVTRNASDFRPSPGSRSTSSLYLHAPTHAGLVCLNLAPGARRADQLTFFQAALTALLPLGNLENQVLEIDPHASDPSKVTVRRYALPNPAPPGRPALRPGDGEDP